jgi:hypothetical protein
MTTYYPQTDGASKRTNQIVEIALRFYIRSMKDSKEWPFALGQIQGTFNNTTSFISLALNEVCYNFTLNFAIDLNNTTLEIDQPKAQIQAADIIDYTNISMKYHYDCKHTPMFLKIGEYALIQLYKGYHILFTTNKKLDQ